jgi:hypothetical protein
MFKDKRFKIILKIYRKLDIITNLIKVQNNKINYTLNKKTKTQEEQHLENLYVQRQAIQDYLKNL